MSEARFESPLAHQAAPHGLAVAAREITDRGMIDVRGDAKDRRFAAAAKSVLGLALPSRPRSSESSGDNTVLWLSIDQWLVLCPRSAAADLARRLTEALAGIHSLVVDVSDARAVIRLEGDGVREVLMKGSPVDFTLPDLGPGTVRRLSLGEIAAMVHVVSQAPDVIDLYVFRSYAVFAWDWLVATAREPATVRLFRAQAAPTA